MYNTSIFNGRACHIVLWVCLFTVIKQTEFININIIKINMIQLVIVLLQQLQKLLKKLRFFAGCTLGTCSVGLLRYHS